MEPIDGDALMASCVLPKLKADGYDITFYTNKRGFEVLKNLHFIDHWKEHKDNTIPPNKLDRHYEKISKGYDKVINFTGVIENQLLWGMGQDEYYLSHKQRRKLVGDKSYLEAHMERAGYTGLSGKVQVRFTKDEQRRGMQWKKSVPGFKILWVLAGSSIHKCYPYVEEVSRALVDRIPDAWIFYVGSYDTKLLTFEHPKIVEYISDEIPFRQSMIMARFADVIIGPETGVMVTAGAFNTPKVCLLTHSSRNQLCKEWVNNYSIESSVGCSPCHLLHKYARVWIDVCELQEVVPGGMKMPACIYHDPQEIIHTIETIYKGRTNGRRVQGNFF